VFLTGQDDIDAAVQLLTDQVQTTGKHSSGTHLNSYYFWTANFCCLELLNNTFFKTSLTKYV